MSDILLLPPLWKNQLENVFNQPELIVLKQFLQEQLEQGKTIYPPVNQMFSAFKLTGFNQVKVVILGQDPYHGANQAHGLSFSVLPGNKIPPSLRNIYKELATDVGFQPPDHGYLESWAVQGVLLLNAVMSVEAGNPNSHQNKGWEVLTDQVIKQLNMNQHNLVFMLWGAYAQKKIRFIDSGKHLVLTAPHPSPFSAHKGFLGCRHFSKANQYLRENGKLEIDWQL